MVALPDILDDLATESAHLDDLVSALPDREWLRPTPAPGWDVAHQIAHLTWSDEVALLAVRDPGRFPEVLATAAADPTGFVDSAAARVRADDGPPQPGRLLARWRAGRTALARALGQVEPGTPVPWFGTTMGVNSLATARLMETWAHGVDVRDALGVPVEATGRLRHIAHLGHRTLGMSFAVNGLPAPDHGVLVGLAAPDGTQWTFGPAGATDTVTGTALDFCLLVTRRRHPGDLALVATGTTARRWLGVAQAFAGPPGPDPAPGRNTATTGSAEPAP